MGWDEVGALFPKEAGGLRPGAASTLPREQEESSARRENMPKQVMESLEDL